MKQYDSYKDSGIEWIGKIPSHWEVRRFKFLINKLSSGGTPQSGNSSFYSDDGTPWVTINDMSTNDYIYNTTKGVTKDGIADKNLTIYPEGTMLYSIYATLGKVSVLKVPATINQAILAIDLKGTVVLDYVRYNLKAMESWIFSLSNGNTQFNLNAGKVANFSLVFPPYSDQQTIASYLDKKCGEIDKAIATQEKRVELLKELRQNIITQAVTRGINSDAPLKDSGVEWIGDVPEHWEIRNLKTLLSVPLQYGANESAEDQDDSFPRYIRITDISEDGKLKDETWKSLSPEKAKDYLLKKGDVLFARSGATVGKTYKFDEDYAACYAGYLIKATCNKQLSPDYLLFYTQSGLYNNWKNSIFIQSTIQNIGADKYSYLPIVLPPLSEQLEIVSYIESQTARLDKSIEKAEHQIELLQELKQSIITEVVTGKRKVC